MGQGNEQVGERAERKAGYCWQENELYVVFQPIIGALATQIFCTLTNLSYGAEVKASLRELALMTGISKDTVQRSLQVMAAVGMIRTRGLSARMAGKYTLMDLKVLTMGMGGVYLRNRASYGLPVAQSDRLRAEVKLLLVMAQRKPVAQSDRGKRPEIATSVCVSDRSVALSGGSVALAGHALDNKTQEYKEEKKEPPTPLEKTKGDAREANESAGKGNAHAGTEAKSTDGVENAGAGTGGDRRVGGEQAEAADDNNAERNRNALAAERVEPVLAGIPDGGACQNNGEGAVGGVMRECGFAANKRLQAEIAGALELERLRSGECAEAVAARMIASWRRYQGLGSMRGFVWGPAKFYREGHWTDPGSWPLDRKAVQQLRTQPATYAMPASAATGMTTEEENRVRAQIRARELRRQGKVLTDQQTASLAAWDERNRIAASHVASS